MTAGMPALLEVENLNVHFPQEGRIVQAVRQSSFALGPGETLGLVGESGSGKSVTALALMGLLPGNAQVTASRLAFAGRDLQANSARDWRALRGAGIAMIFQDPMTSLNPLMRCGEQVAEVLRLHRGMAGEDARKAVIELFEEMDLPEPERRFSAFPYELSGGQRQRVMIAMALAGRPKLLIADEPTTALDVTVQAQILKLLSRAQKQHGMALILITHDLDVVRDTVDEVLVMYAGYGIEQGSVKSVLAHPRHPYTQGLLASIPNPIRPTRRLDAIPGMVPAGYAEVPGCRFHPRCKRAEAACAFGGHPALLPVPGNALHAAACPVAARDYASVGGG